MARTWLKLDDSMVEHPKCVGLSPFAWTLWIHAISYCSRNLTDGLIPQSILPRLCSINDAQKAAAELVDAGLWHVTEGGWMVEIEVVREGDRPRMPDWLRAEIFERDGTNCRHCGSGDHPQIDHITPWARGGAFLDPSNLQVLCRACNSSKGARWVG